MDSPMKSDSKRKRRSSLFRPKPDVVFDETDTPFGNNEDVSMVLDDSIGTPHLISNRSYIQLLKEEKQKWFKFKNTLKHEADPARITKELKTLRDSVSPESVLSDGDKKLMAELDHIASLCSKINSEMAAIRKGMQYLQDLHMESADLVSTLPNATEISLFNCEGAVVQKLEALNV